MPAPSTVHTDAVLARMATGFPVSDGIADRIYPTLLVDKQSDLYTIFDEARVASKQVDDSRAPGARPKNVDFEKSQGTYFCNDHRLGARITDEEIANEDRPLLAMSDKIRVPANNLKINQEIDAATTLVAGITGDQTASPASTALNWAVANNATSDPETDINTGINQIASACGFPPNIGWCDSLVWQAVRRHPDFVDIVKSGGSNNRFAQPGTQGFAAYFGLDEFFVVSAFSNVAVPGVSTPSMSRIWGDDFWLQYQTKEPEGDRRKTIPTACYKFVWNKFERSGGREVVSEYDKLAKVTEMAIGRYYDQAIIQSAATYRFADALTAV